MEELNIRQKLHRFIETIEDKRAQAIYTIFEDEIEQEQWEYTEEFKTELDQRLHYYRNGGIMETSNSAKQQLGKFLKGGKT